MATTLPTVTVTDAQAGRILAAFQALAGTTTQAETARAYRRWLTRQVRDVVLAHEARRLDEDHNTAKREALAVLAEGLPDPDREDTP